MLTFAALSLLSSAVATHQGVHWKNYVQRPRGWKIGASQGHRELQRMPASEVTRAGAALRRAACTPGNRSATIRGKEQGLLRKDNQG